MSSLRGLSGSLDSAPDTSEEGRERERGREREKERAGGEGRENKDSEAEPMGEAIREVKGGKHTLSRCLLSSSEKPSTMMESRKSISLT